MSIEAHHTILHSSGLRAVLCGMMWYMTLRVKSGTHAEEFITFQLDVIKSTETVKRWKHGWMRVKRKDLLVHCLKADILISSENTVISQWQSNLRNTTDVITKGLSNICSAATEEIEDSDSREFLSYFSKKGDTKSHSLDRINRGRKLCLFFLFWQS